MSGKVLRTCEYCPNRFMAYLSEVKRGGGRYCSVECNYKAKSLKVERICEYCGIRFLARRAVVEKGEGKFCSNQCAHNGHYTRVDKICENCGITYQAYACRADESRFCSKECFDIYRTVYNTKVTCTCEICGKVFKTYRAEIAKGGGKVCSRECYPKYLSKMTSGEKSHMWKGGTIEYYGPNWLFQRRKALARDNYICQYCGKKKPKSKNHQVHHIIPFRNFGYIRGQNDNYKQANSLKNLITLCSGCHRKAENGAIAIQPRLI